MLFCILLFFEIFSLENLSIDCTFQWNLVGKWNIKKILFDQINWFRTLVYVTLDPRQKKWFCEFGHFACIEKYFPCLFLKKWRMCKVIAKRRRPRPNSTRCIISLKKLQTGFWYFRQYQTRASRIYSRKPLICMYLPKCARNHVLKTESKTVQRSTVSLVLLRFT